MQLTSPERGRSIRPQLRAAACVLLAGAASRPAQAADPAPTNTVDVTTLVYSERITVVEPTVRFTRLYPDGRSFHGQVIIDSITGASPTGALPSGITQTVTSASGHLKTISGGTIPTTDFKDTRYALDGEWSVPKKTITYTLGSHISTEKDYQSLGVTGKASFDLNSHLTTLTMGAGYNWDEVFPVGGIVSGLSPPGTLTGGSRSPKQVASALFGVSQVLTRRWLVGGSVSLAQEHGYLTEPYKVVSVMNASTGIPQAQLTEERPDTRQRFNVQLDSVYHFTKNLLYVTMGHSWDDWGVRANSLDLNLRHPISDLVWIEPHFRYYAQGAADFFHVGLVAGQPIPEFASADYRLGLLNTTTAGLTLAFKPRDYPGEWTVRAEYLNQSGDSHPDEAIGVQQQYDLSPTLGAWSIVVGYNLQY
jgi:uncharacterized protein DUF3570